MTTPKSEVRVTLKNYIQGFIAGFFSCSILYALLTFVGFLTGFIKIVEN